MSTTLQDPNIEPASSASATIALIGPNATHRRVMAKALLGSDAGVVREFIDYPANLGEIAHLMEEHFDVVMIDVDSDQSYALQIIQSIAGSNTAIVMAYSMRDDPELIRECMRAGARDFLPLPVDASAEAEPEPVPEPLPVPETAPVLEPVPALETAPSPEPEPAVNPADFLRSEPAAPEVAEAPLNPRDFLLETPRKVEEPSVSVPAFQPQEYSVPSRPQFVDPRRSAAQPAPQPASQPAFQPLPKPVAKSAQQPIPLPPPTSEVRRTEAAATHIQPEELRRSSAAVKPSQEAVSTPSKGDEIDAWDSMWIKPALSGAAKATAPSVAPAPEAPAKQTPGSAFQSGPQLVQRAAQQRTEAQSAPSPAATPLFRAVDSEQEAGSQHPWKRWAILGGAFLAVIGLIMLVFLPSHRTSAPASQQAQPAAAQTQPADGPVASAPLETRPAPKPSAATPLNDEQPRRAPVSSAMMDAQLNAPTRIAGSLKKSSQQTDDAPGSFSPGAIDGGGALPGQVFGQSRGVKVVAAVSAISAGVAEGMLVHKTAPVYPEIAKNAHVGGTVVLGANITKSGALTNLHVLSGPSMLRSPALEAVKTWRYRPYMLDNQPVEVETTIRVVFSLAP
jgi:protein TonB